MCFSASASFIASAGLGVLGAASLKRAKKRERLLALIPLLFAVQQFIEGLQWLVVVSGKASLALGYAYLFFAFLLWPTYIPFMALQLETRERRKPALRFFLLLGIVMTVYLASALLTHPVAISVFERHISCEINLPFAVIGAVIYVTIVTGSLIASSVQHVRIFGFLALFSSILAWQLYEATFTSVWCFFAAVLSSVVYLHFHKKTT